MIHALTPFAVRGAIWYQGENNRNDGLFYEKKMEALIKGWRSAWKLGDFPFYYVQLAPYNYGYNRETPTGDIPDFLRLPYIWEAQVKALRIPNTGMAVITDITNLNDIHPANKKDVGYRLSLWARANTYGEKTLVFSGPLYRSMTVEGNLMRLSFDHVGGGLTHERRPAAQVVRDRRRGPYLLQGRGRDRRGHGRRLEPARRGSESGPLRLEPAGRAQPGQQGRPAGLSLPHRQLVNVAGQFAY